MAFRGKLKADYTVQANGHHIMVKDCDSIAKDDADEIAPEGQPQVRSPPTRGQGEKAGGGEGFYV